MGISPKDAEERDEREREADVVRGRLGVTLDELDRRGHEMFDVRKQLARYKKPLALLLAAAALAALGAAVFTARRRPSRSRRLNQQRLQALQRAWHHPEQVAPKKRTWFFEAGRRLSMTVVEAVGARAIERLVDGRHGPAAVVKRQLEPSSEATGAWPRP